MVQLTKKSEDKLIKNSGSRIQQKNF